MPKFTDAKDLERHLKKAMDALVAEVLITAQAELGSTAVSPVDTGRFRSSWFAAEGSASTEVAPEGADDANEDARGLRVDSNQTYHLTNSLPYAQAIAVEGKTNPKVNTKSKPANWFIDFVNTRIPKIQEGASRLIAKQFEVE
jgi:hypothetical protein